MNIIQVNLLPFELRQQAAADEPKPIHRFFLCVFFLILIVTLYQFFVFALARMSVHELEAERARLKTTSEKAISLSKIVNDQLGPKKKFFETFVVPSAMFSEVMNELSNLLPDNVWFSQVRLTRGQETFGLELTGYSKITSQEVALAQIQGYINAIKEKSEEIVNRPMDEGQPKGHKIKAVLTTNREMVGNTEVMRFNVSFQF